MSGERPITEDDLQSYVDDALDTRRRAAVDTYLRDHPDVAQRVATDLAHRDSLRAALAPIAEEPIPADLNLERLIERRRRPAWESWRAAAAAIVLLVVGAAGGWSIRGINAPASAGIASLTQEAVDSYAVYAPDQVRPVEIAATDKSMLVQWGSRRLDRPVSVPDLTAAGFRFVGGRLVATPHGPAVLYMFDNGLGTRLIMLTRNMAIDRNRAMSPTSRGGVAAVSWATDGLGFSLVGPIQPERLHPIADVARAQLDKDI